MRVDDLLAKLELLPLGEAVLDAGNGDADENVEASQGHHHHKEDKQKLRGA